MGGKEKTILVIANVPDYKGSEKKTVSNESGQPPPSSAPPPIPMSPIVEKMEGLKAIRNRSNSLRLGRLAFYRHLEKVGTMRSFWELKYVELHGGNQQKPGGRKLSLNGSEKPQSASFPPSCPDAALRSVEVRMDSLSSQMERLLYMQQTVLNRLDGLTLDVTGMGRDLASMREEAHGWWMDPEGGGLRRAVERVGERVEVQGRRLEGVERLVEGTQQVISFIGGVVKGSRLVELLFRQNQSRRGRKAKDEKDKTKQSQKKRKPVDAADVSSLDEPDQVEKLNRQNADSARGVDTASGGQNAEPGDVILDGGHAPTAPLSSRQDDKKDGEEEEEEEEFDSSESEEEESKVEGGPGRGEEEEEEDSAGTRRRSGEKEESPEDRTPAQESSEDVGESATCSKRRVTEEDVVKEEPKKSRVEDGEEQNAESEVSEPQEVKSDETKTDDGETTNKEESSEKEFIIDSTPPPMAPFEHRIVTPKPHQISNYYTINRDEVLGGGRFGQVHKCTENSTSLTLAAKIIKARSQKEKEVVRNEIQVMNQLNHANLIQLYAAFESRHDIILVMEYVEGGELFDRIIDENYNLTELDTVLFIRQICEGLQYMHKMYILHLDLKPENILCVSRVTNKVKIIDFGLARRYKPREKLRVNFGTPEFLAPEVINYEFVSFPTDMWSLGVITYMLLSGLSPFLGDDDNETLNNILACQWNFEEDEFSDISDEAKDFITRLLVKSKSWRMSAAESLRHAWLSDHSLHYTLHQKKNKCHSTHAPPPPES